MPESKNISATWSRTYTALLFQNWEHVPGAETYVPCVPEIENSFLQIFFVSGFLKGNLAIGRTETEQSPWISRQCCEYEEGATEFLLEFNNGDKKLNLNDERGKEIVQIYR